jgi:AmmeMemoRadiSam system protein A
MSLPKSFSDSDETAPTRMVLLEVARKSIECGVESGQALEVDPDDYSPELRREAATFVTLHRCNQLRGCVGTLVASRPLVADVAHSAFRAAFRDGRFPALNSAELDGLDVHISVLSPLEPLSSPDEASLLEQIRPGVDGLVLRDGPRQGTFLPAVWERVPDPMEFLRELKIKAGLPVDAWSADWDVLRYTVESIP